MSDERLPLRRRHWTITRRDDVLHDEPVLGAKRTTNSVEPPAAAPTPDVTLPRQRSAALQNRDPVRRSSAKPAAPSVASPYLTANEAADYCRVSVKTLERYRQTGGGPLFRKGGGSSRSKSRVVYHIDDLDEWLRPMSSTSDDSQRR